MPNTDWERIKEILDEVLQIAPSERQRYLSEAGISDEVRNEVESLLSFESKAEKLMKISAIEFSEDFFSSADSENS